MAEYIEREAAFNAVLKLVPKVDDDGYCWVIRGDAATAIDSIPAADVRPVVRGKWEYTVIEGDVISEIPTVVKGVCSVCHNYSEEIPKWIYDDGGCIWFNFCPHLRG